MRPPHRLLRFFRLVPPVHPIARIGLALTAGIGALLVVLGATPASALLGPLVLLQALATSAGFAVPARRGHYDLLFTLGYSRAQVAAAQWAMSAAAGTGSWLALAATEAIVASSMPSLLGPVPVALMACVSTVPWALTIHLPRLSGGVGLAVSAAFVWAVMPAPVRTATMALAERGGVVESIAVVAASAAALAAALRVVARMDVPLEAAQ